MTAPDASPRSLATGRPLGIVVVCTGNICRSAFAASYLRHGLADRAPGVFDVTSAGTGTAPGLTVPREVLDLGEPLGLDVAGHRARQLTPGIIRAADLVLTATRAHRSATLAEVPGALKRTYLLTEFADLLRIVNARPGPDADAWRVAISQVVAHRGAVTPTDVPDPYGRGRPAYDAMARQLMPLLEVIVAAAR